MPCAPSATLAPYTTAPQRPRPLPMPFLSTLFISNLFELFFHQKISHTHLSASVQHRCHHPRARGTRQSTATCWTSWRPPSPQPDNYIRLRPGGHGAHPTYFKQRNTSATIPPRASFPTGCAYKERGISHGSPLHRHTTGDRVTLSLSRTPCPIRDHCTTHEGPHY